MSKDRCALDPSYGHLKFWNLLKNTVSAPDSARNMPILVIPNIVVPQPHLSPTTIPKILTLIFGNVAPVKLTKNKKTSVANGISPHAPYGSLYFDALEDLNPKLGTFAINR
jgi:hypothetical protein